MKHIAILLSLLSFMSLQAQTIQFSLNVSSSIDASKDQDMAFDEVFAGSGLTEIGLGDPGMGVFAITGDKDLDVVVSISAPTDLTHSGLSTDTLPFSMSFAYANRGSNDINQATVVAGTTARFQILSRENGPPKPPPTPRTNAFTQIQGTAYVYVYGTLNVGTVDAGQYAGTVEITVTYD